MAERSEKNLLNVESKQQNNLNQSCIKVTDLACYIELVCKQLDARLKLSVAIEYYGCHHLYSD